MASREEQLVTRFIEAINAQDLAALVALISHDHQFIDSLGRVIAGADAVREAWRRYFEFCPDYWLEAQHVFREGERVAVFGVAGGTVRQNAWRTPAAWLACVGGARLSSWQVFADNRPVYDILARTSGAADAASGGEG